MGDEAEYDIITISGLLKNYFRELPKSVFPQKLYNELIAIPRTVPPHLLSKKKKKFRWITRFCAP